MPCNRVQQVIRRLLTGWSLVRIRFGATYGATTCKFGGAQNAPAGLRANSYRERSRGRRVRCALVLGV
jgi:hypothetical protein